MTDHVDGELSIEVSSKEGTSRRVHGWTSVEVNTGIEVFPSSFEIGLTEKYPDSSLFLVVNPGDSCKVFIGNDLVLTGWIDRYVAEIDAHNHTVTITGRSKTSDLIDCSAYFGPAGEGLPGGQITTVESPMNITDLAKRLAAPFKINVVNLNDDEGKQLPPFVINLGETPWDILSRVAKYSGFLVMDNEKGELVLDRSGSKEMASGFAQGKNVQEASVSYSQDQRWSDYYVINQSVSAQSDNAVPIHVHHATDPEWSKMRFRPKYNVSALYGSVEGNGEDLAEQEALWEANRNFGRSQAIQLVCDSWRDSSGKLWARNAMAPVDMPSIKAPNKHWIIAQVTFRRDLDNGTTAELVLMDKRAFEIEPILITPPVPPENQASPPADPPQQPANIETLGTSDNTLTPSEPASTEVPVS